MVDNLLRTIPTMQSIALLSYNLPKKKKKKSITEQGIDNIIGVSMIKATSDII